MAPFNTAAATAAIRDAAMRRLVAGCCAGGVFATQLLKAVVAGQGGASRPMVAKASRFLFVHSKVRRDGTQRVVRRT